MKIVKEVLYNEKINVPNIRVIYDKQDLGIIPTSEAIKIAKEQGLDVVVVSTSKDLTVAKLLDYKKYLYDLKRKEKHHKKMSKSIETKTLQLRYCTDTHDLNIKLNHAREFLEKGNKITFLMKFRKREITHIKTGQELINKIVDILNVSIDKPIQVSERSISITLRK